MSFRDDLVELMKTYYRTHGKMPDTVHVPQDVEFAIMSSLEYECGLDGEFKTDVFTLGVRAAVAKRGNRMAGLEIVWDADKLKVSRVELKGNTIVGPPPDPDKTSGIGGGAIGIQYLPLDDYSPNGQSVIEHMRHVVEFLKYVHKRRCQDGRKAVYGWSVDLEALGVMLADAQGTLKQIYET